MRRTFLGLALTVAVTAAITYSVSRYSLEQPASTKNVVEGVLRSNVLKEDRTFLVHLPESYAHEANRRYPVLYVLDGSSHAMHTAKSAALMARIGVTPEMLVIGIPSGQGRSRDYTPPGMRQDVEAADGPKGQAGQFLAFLKSELMPRSEGEYRTSGMRMLAGHSRGGLLVVYSLIAEPSLFEARFAHSPALWRDDDAIIVDLERFLATSPRLDGFLYLSLGDQENDKMTRSFKRAQESLRANAPGSLQWHAVITRGAVHNTNSEVATPVGLYAFFTRRQPALPQ